jgi:hypothetical protein
VLSSLGVELQGPVQPGRLTRRQFLRTLEELAAAAQVGHTPRQATHEVVTLWWSLPDSTDGEVTGIEDLDDREHSLIVRLYGHYSDVTDDDMPPDLAEQAATEFWSTLGELVNYVQSRPS